MKNIFVILFISFLISSESSTSGAPFRYGTNAKEVSLSGATVSIYNSGFNAFSNPAFISKSKKHEFGLSYFLMSLDRSIQSISYSRSISSSAGVGLSFLRTSVDKITQTDLDNNIIGSLDYFETLAAMSFALRVNKLSVGSNLKIYQSNLHNYTADGIGFDIGFNYRLNNHINLAICSKNIGATYKWDYDQDEDIPVITSFGASYQDTHSTLNDLIITMQLDYKDSEYEKYKLGVEINPFRIIKFRFGLKENNSNDTSHLIYFGAGYKLQSEIFGNMNIDYALDPGAMGEGMTHLFSFTFLRN